MSEIYLKRLREFASIDIRPAILSSFEKEYKDKPGFDDEFAKIKEIVYGDGAGLDQEGLDAYYFFKYFAFYMRGSFILVEMGAYYKSEEIFSSLIDILLLIEDKLNINGIFDTLRNLPDYYSINLIKSIDNSEYDQEELIDCIAQNNKKEFLEILRRERYDITLLTQICSLYNRAITNLDLITSGNISNLTEEALKKLHIKDIHYIREVMKYEDAEQCINGLPIFIFDMIHSIFYLYWKDKKEERFTTTEKNILEGIVSEIRNTPVYLELYEKYHKDGVFFPDVVDDSTIEDVEAEVVTNLLPESPREQIDTSKKYEGDVPLYCQSKNRSGKEPLKLDKYYATDRSRLMTLLEALAENGFIGESEINSFYTHFTGFGDNYNVSKKLHWRKEDIRDLSFFIYLMYPYECNDTVRYDPIKEYIEYKHESSSYSNGANFASAATRPTPDLKKLLRKLYLKSESKPERYSKL